MLKELENNKALILSNSGIFSVINLKNQNVEITKNIKALKNSSVYNFSIYSDTKKIVILSKNSSSIYVVGFNFQGTQLFDFSIPSNNKTEGIYLPNGIIAISNKDWTVKGFLPYQDTTKIQQNLLKHTIKNYPSFYNDNNFLHSSQYLSILNKRNYGFREEEIIAYIKDSIYEISTKNAVGGVVGVTQSEIDNYQELIELINLAAFSGVDFSHQIATIIDNSNDTSVLKSAFVYASINGFDPSSKMINAIENKLSKTSTIRKDDKFYTTLCDAVYNICKTMGTPILFNQGKRILTRLLTINLSQNVRNHITSTLNLILSLQM
jgi:hypothetical protein